ncbi:MAG TPA: NmrA family NAD(P)-binding protein [Solirubrobacteraceae bacterium]|nr:NmrA family NAD(P)-binding protein [Solirubrobacteraceae bacterium]
MIVVTGATGNVGSELVAALALQGLTARAVVRDRDAALAGMPAGVEVVEGDLELPESLTPALRGADSVFLLGGWSDMPGVLRRIADAGVGHVVLLTSRCVIGGQPTNAITRMWLDAEAAVRDSGVPATFLRPSGYQSNALRWLSQLRAGDVVRAPWGEVPVAAIDPADIAAVAAAVFADPAAHAGRAHELSGPEPLTPGAQVATLADVLGRPLRYEAVSDEEAKAEMAADTPQPYIDAFFRFYSEGEFDDSRVVGTVKDLTGRAPRRFETWARDHAAAFALPRA